MPNIALPVLACIILSAAVLPANAADHAFTLHNNLTKPITSFKVSGGEVSGFKAIAPGNRITFTVVMPGSDCVARVTASAGGRREGRVNLCDKGGYVLTPAEGGAKFLPLSQVMLAN